MTGNDQLRQRIILLLGNALYTGKSIEQISKITKKQLQPFENAADSIMALIRQDRRELLERLKQGYSRPTDMTAEALLNAIDDELQRLTGLEEADHE